MLCYSSFNGMRILLVEDDPEMCSMLQQVLSGAGFSVDLAMDGATGLNKALSRRHAAIVLDLMLPRIDGLRLCNQLRHQGSSTPILMVTARNSINDRVRGLETGADDYLHKPFDSRELIARLQALIRRDRAVKTKKIHVGSLVIDTHLRTASVASEVLRLTRLEFGILEILAGQLGRVVHRETFLEFVWQDREPGSNKLEVAIRSLRRKLERAGLPELIETVYGLGYRLISPAAKEIK